MSTRGSRFSLRAAVAASPFPRRRSALRPATDTIFAQRAAERPATASRVPAALPIAAILVMATTIAAGIVSRAAILSDFDRHLFRYNGIIVPLFAGVLAILFFAGRGVARGRALAALAIAAALCPLLAAFGSSGVTTIALLVSAAIAFAALAIGLDWIGSRDRPGALSTAILVAASQLGTAIGAASSRDLLSGPGLPILSAGLIALVIPAGLVAAGFRRRPERDAQASIAAIQTALGSYAMLGLVVAGLLATTSVQILFAATSYLAPDGETAASAAVMTQAGALIALIAGGLFADRVTGNDRGYALWFAATLGLAGVVALLSDHFGLVAAGHAILAARLLPSAGVGAALALIFTLAPPTARLGALIAFLAARAIGAAVVAPLLQKEFTGMTDSATSYGAIGLLIAAAAVAVTMPRRGRKD